MSMAHIRGPDEAMKRINRDGSVAWLIPFPEGMDWRLVMRTPPSRGFPHALSPNGEACSFDRDMAPGIKDHPVLRSLNPGGRRDYYGPNATLTDLLSYGGHV
jgi:hypothetical protein